ncbi:Aldo kereductase [Rhizoctonia solani]|uniref:Aldo kereductase n=1 Tax=Rhizoctonia solani TaxID=456999 RepID=A0A8H7IMS3_9AGAM|nr:Aldo kereductase [Rhizoctonia solani]
MDHPSLSPNNNDTDNNYSWDPIVKIGHGLMSMSWVPEPPPDEQCFESIIADINAAPLELRFSSRWRILWDMAKHNSQSGTTKQILYQVPEYAERTFLSVKASLTAGVTKSVLTTNAPTRVQLFFSGHSFSQDCSPAGLERSIIISFKNLVLTRRSICSSLRGLPNVSIEETISELNKHVESGSIGSIGLSECSAATLERASKVKVAAVEIEVSLWSYEEETRKVISKAAEIGAVIAAYSKDDHRSRFPRFQEEVITLVWFRVISLINLSNSQSFKNNVKLVNALKDLAEKKGITLPSSALPGSPLSGNMYRAARTVENASAASIELSKQELEEITHIIGANPISGDRYPEEVMKTVWR